jgi:predicted enzyme related to lactoylglutathione lyase
MVGVMNKTPEMGEMPNAWAVYFEVNNTDETVAHAQELGANVIAPPFDVPGTGRIAWLMDPTGAVFGVIASDAERQQ